MDTKRLFIIGASPLQLPAIRRAKELGLYVGVADYNPMALGVKEAHEYFNVSTIDEEGVCSAAAKFRADGIMTLATDMPMRCVAHACSKLGLCGISYQTAVMATDKGEMIKAFERAGVAHPWYYIVDNAEQAATLAAKITYPCISKPTDNSGSRGVTLIETPRQLEEAFLYSSSEGRSGSVIIEEYMRGNEVSVEVIVLDGVPHILQVTDKLTTGAPHFVETGHTQPSRLAAADIEAIRSLAARASLAVGIQNGPAHVEIMLTDDGPKMIELGARMGGDCITTHLVPLSTGIDMVEATIRIALGEKPDITPLFAKGSAIRYFITPAGTLTTVKGVTAARELDGVKEITFTKQIGERVGQIGNSADRIGFVVAQGSTAGDAEKNAEEAINAITVGIEE